MEMKKVIINADDFGYSKHTVDATIQCFNEGILSSATMMPTMPAFDDALEFAKCHDEFSYGLHLCLTDELPISPPESIKSLIDEETGRLLPTRTYWKKAFMGQLKVEDVLKESRAQLQKILQAGIKISHLDSHGHIHKAPQVLHILPQLCKEFNIKAIRRTQNLYYPTKTKKGFGPIYNNLSQSMISRCSRTTDYFLMVTDRISTSDEDWWKQAISLLPNGVTEIGIHPGTLEEKWRTIETIPIMKDKGQTLKRYNVKLITYNEI